jgi:hypothetical protein
MTAIAPLLSTAGSGFLRSLRCGAAAMREEYAFRRRLTPAARRPHWPLDLPVEGRYIVSSERGIYEVSYNELRLLSKVPAFGIARAGDDFYAATWRARSSVVLAGSWSALIAGSDCRWREIYSIETQSEAGRIHQIAASDDCLWLANTALNALTKIDRRSGTWRAGIAPFRCSYGQPIIVDHNHVNSVFPQPGYLLFAAFRISRRSALGLVGDGMVRLFGYNNMGVHDCILAGNDLYFSDSYRFWEGVGGGAVRIGDAVIDRAHFDTHPAFFVRGLAGTDGELVIGNSHVGERESRFSGEGALLLARGSRVTHRARVPFAQIYDILRDDGAHLPTPPTPRTFAEASAVLQRVFGDPVEELPLSEALIGPKGKKFDARDIGDIPEYLGA